MVEDKPKDRFTTIHYALGLAIILLVTFGKLLTSDFTWWDDPHTVHQNPFLNPARWDSFEYYWSNQAANIYIPLTYTVWILLSFIARVDSGEFGISLNPWVYHSANVLFHIGTAIVAFKLLEVLVKDKRAAFFGALLFSIHPEQVESVGWISGLKDVLAGLFSIAAMWQYACFAEKSGKKHYLSSIILFLLATLSKPSAMTTPAILLVIDALVSLGRSESVFSRQYAIRFIKRILPFAFITLPIAMLARSIQHGIVHVSPAWSRPLVMLDSISFYITKLFLPININVDYGRNPVQIIQTGQIYYTWILSLAVLLVCLFLFRRGKTYPLAGFLIFILAPFHVLGLTTFDYQAYSTVADHYQYVALLGPALWAAYLLRSWSWKSKLALSIYIPFFAITSFLRCGAWKDDQTLLVKTFEINPRSMLAIPNLAAYCIRTQRYDDAQYFSKLAFDLDPNDPVVLVNQGAVELSLRHFDLAKPIFERLITTYQRQYGTDSKANIDAYIEVADKYLSCGIYEIAQEYQVRALKIDPGNKRLANLQKRIDTCKAQTRGRMPTNTPTTSP